MITGTFNRTIRFNKSFSDDITFESSSIKERVPLARFDSYKHPFVMLASYCNNSECDCDEASLEFIEIDEAGAIIANPIRFHIYLDLKQWQENRKPKRSKIAQRLVDEFFNSLTDEMKTRFEESYDFVKRNAKNAAKFIKSTKEIRSGQMFPHTDVFGDIKSVLSGGQGASFSFHYKGRNCLVEDIYCVDPNCNCEALRLMFLEYDEKSRVLSDLFECRLYFKNGLEIEDHPGCTSKEAMKIFEEWQKSDPYVIGELKRRYSKMKEVGKDLIIKDDVPKKTIKQSLNSNVKGKIGRNMPCPCGSGKKYKMCCGK